MQTTSGRVSFNFYPLKRYVCTQKCYLVLFWHIQACFHVFFLVISGIKKGDLIRRGVIRWNASMQNYCLLQIFHINFLPNLKILHLFKYFIIKVTQIWKHFLKQLSDGQYLIKVRVIGLIKLFQNNSICNSFRFTFRKDYTISNTP